MMRGCAGVRAGSALRALASATIAWMMVLGGLARPALGAAASGRVIILQPNPLSGAARRCLTRVREELTAGGFEVTQAEFGPGVDPLWVVDPKDPNDGAVATIALVGNPEASASELWIVDRVAAGRSAVRRIMVPAGDGARAAEVVAIRALEFLRASTLQLVADSLPGARPALVQAAAKPEPAVAPAAEIPPPSEDRRLVVEAGVSVLDSMSAIDPAIVPLARLRGRLAGPLVARLTLAGLGSRPKVVNAIGSATVGYTLGLLELITVFRSTSRVRPSISGIL